MRLKCGTQVNKNYAFEGQNQAHTDLYRYYDSLNFIPIVPQLTA